jgi:hypothetical protein
VYIREVKENAMTTLTLKIDEKKKAGKTLLELIDFFNSKEKKAVEVLEGESPYNPEFVKKVLASAKSKKRHRIDPENVWQSIS